ncbi:Eco57I restriction-modification methylase domain-containing protein [candidate division KSB1 bacterium]
MFSKDPLGEHFQNSIKKDERKLLGQFYTPEEIVAYVVSRVEIDINKKIIDLSCGSGRFLMKAYDNLYTLYMEAKYNQREIHKAILKENLYGIDLNPLAVKLTEMNLVLKGSEYFPVETNIFEGNSLIKADTAEDLTLFSSPFEEHQEELKNILKNNSYDITIGNPPYLSFGLKGTGKLEKEWHAYIKQRYPFSAQYKISTYALYLERGIELLKNGGFLGYILPDSFLLGRYFSNLRKYILDTCIIKEIILFSKDFWKSGLVGKPVILILQKEKDKLKRKNNHLKTVYCEDPQSLLSGKYLSYSYRQNTFEKTRHNRFRLFFSKETKDIVEKIEKAEYSLNQVVVFSSGLIGKKGKNDIISSKKENKNWYPGLQSSSEIDRYIINHKGGYISFEKERLKSGFKKARYFEPKLFLRQTGDSLKAAYDENNFLCLNNLHVGNMINESFDILYILAILNSNLMDEYYRTISLESGRALAQIDIETINELPIKYTDKKNQRKIANIVWKIMRQKNPKKIISLEKKLENIITGIYYI